MRRHSSFQLPPGSQVHIHQAFKCCPYAGMVTSQIHAFVELNGYHVVDDPADAVAHVINTCGSDATQAALTFEAIEAVRQIAPQSALVITGCLNSIEPRRIEQALEGVVAQAMFDPRNLSGLDEVFSSAKGRFEQVQPSIHNKYTGTEFSDGWFHVGVSTGCFGTCTFCAIRRATGRPKSRTIPEILADVRRGMEAGQRDILLVSTDASAWGTDHGLSVVDLLDAVAGMPGEALFSAESFEPTLFLEHFERLLPILASGRFAFIGMPIQSGNPRILAQMQRHYPVDEVLGAVARLKAARPDIVVRTDFIYAFGDETEEEFQDSLRVSRRFDLPAFNAYQERPGTARMLHGEEVLASRRQAVMDELRERARQGWPTVRRVVPLPPDAPSKIEAQRREAFTEPREMHVGPPQEYLDWLVDQRDRFTRLLARRGTIPLAAGWEVVRAYVHPLLHAVALVVHRAGRSFEVGLRRGDQAGSYMARSDRFAMWMITPDFHPDHAQDEALKVLLNLLQLKVVNDPSVASLVTDPACRPQL